MEQVNRFFFEKLKFFVFKTLIIPTTIQVSHFYNKDNMATQIGCRLQMLYKRAAHKTHYKYARWNPHIWFGVYSRDNNEILCMEKDLRVVLRSKQIRKLLSTRQTRQSV